MGTRRQDTALAKLSGARRRTPAQPQAPFAADMGSENRGCKALVLALVLGA